MNSDVQIESCEEEGSPRFGSRDDLTGHTRRDVVRTGVKLAFVAPVISTFFAKDAHAAQTNNMSCYPEGRACATDLACCTGNCDLLGDETCKP